MKFAKMVIVRRNLWNIEIWQEQAIDTHKEDIKDKDTFAQTAVKAKNDLQKELVLLKNKNNKLNKENIDLLERVKQLDEDTDDGI